MVELLCISTILYMYEQLQIELSVLVSGFRKVKNSFHLILKELKESKNVQLQYINVWFGLVHKSYKPAASIDFCLGLK